MVACLVFSNTLSSSPILGSLSLKNRESKAKSKRIKQKSKRSDEAVGLVDLS